MSLGCAVMRMALSLVSLHLFLLASLFAQEALNNDSVIKLVKSGLGEDMVVTVVKTQPGKYSLAPDDLVALKKAGVSDKVIAAMLAQGAEAGESAGKGASVPNLPTAVGVYFNQNGNWTPLMSEPVYWQPGGVLKNVATLGMVNLDVNGWVSGPHSNTALHAPAEFLIRVPEGAEVTEYHLIRFHAHRKDRQFRVVSGGAFHATGGAKRDLVPFDFRKAANHAFTVELHRLEPGEYGFLAPGPAMQSDASAQRGKIYTFQALQ